MTGAAGALAGGAMLAGGAAAVGAIGAGIAGGLANMSRTGGTFAGGAASTAVSAAAAIPVIGELLGATQTRDAQRMAVSDMNQITNQVARFGGPNAISDDVRTFLADRAQVQAQNVVEDQRRNLAQITNRTDEFAKGEPIGKLTGAIDRLIKAIEDAGRGGGLF